MTGLVAYWPLDEPDGVRYDASNGCASDGRERRGMRRKIRERRAVHRPKREWRIPRRLSWRLA